MVSSGNFTENAPSSGLCMAETFAMPPPADQPNAITAGPCRPRAWGRSRSATAHSTDTGAGVKRRRTSTAHPVLSIIPYIFGGFTLLVVLLVVFVALQAQWLGATACIVICIIAVAVLAPGATSAVAGSLARLIPLRKGDDG